MTLLVVGLLVAGQLDAQPLPAPKTAAPQATVQVKLSVSDMKTQSQAMRDQVRANIQRIQHLQALARKAQDVIKLTCVNDRYVRLKAEANLFDLAHRELGAVLETDERFAVYDRIVKSAEEVRKIREEADTCIGGQELSDQSANAYTAPEIVDDPTLTLPFDIEVEPPAYASPYI